jgi:hypothetical protein
VCSKNPRRSPSSKQGSERTTLFVAEEIDPSRGRAGRRWWSRDLFIEEENRRLGFIGKTREVLRIVGSGRNSEAVNPQAQGGSLVIARRRIGVEERKDRMHVKNREVRSPDLI